MTERRAERGARLRRRVGVHDRHQFELKLEYQPPAEGRSRYVVEAFVCAPGSLNVTPDTVPPARLYADVHNYVRLRTPRMTWDDLEGSPASPLRIAEAEAARVAAGADAGRFVYECRLFSCVFRAALRAIVQQAGDGEARPSAGAPGSSRPAPAAIGETLDAAGRALARFRAIAAVADRDGFPERARSAFRMADEYASLVVEQLARRAIAALGRRSAAEEGIVDLLLARIGEEERYRRERGYPSILDPAGDNETYLYRAGLLKKYCYGVLFLQVRRSWARAPWEELAFAVAAGLAMAFATVVAFWAHARWGVIGLQVFLALVIGYMLKDRIKEGARRVFARALARRLYERDIRIQDPAGGVLGRFRDKIEYVSPAEMPREARELRREGADPTVRIAEAELAETIFRYRKEVRLHGARLRGRRGGAGVTDIIRFNVASLLREMDEPHQWIPWIDRATRRRRRVRADKVYHVDVVFRFAAREGDPAALTLLRLILDRRGIRRIERADRAP